MVAAAYPQEAHAALIEITVQGSTDNAEGSIDYAPGGVFSAVFVFDTDLAFPNISNAGISQFQEVGDPLRGHSGLISAEVTTPLGTSGFERSLIAPGDELSIASSQRRDGSTSAFPQGQSFGASVQETGVTTFDLSDALFTDMAGTTDIGVLSLSLFSRGPGNTFFTGTTQLLSGQPDLSLDEFFSGVIILSFAGVSSPFEDTELYFGPNDFLSFRLLGDTDPSEVPIPGALLLMLTGVAGLRFAGRRRTACAG